jgi:hypothetical protein
MKYLLQFSLLLVLGIVVVVSRGAKTTAPDEAARAAAIKLFNSVTADQKKVAVKCFNDKERLVEDFPAGNRPGLPMAKMTAGQKKLVEDLVRATTSDYGASRCLAVGRQSGKGQRFVNFFGEPGAKKPFAWRLCQHHLTLVYAQFGDGKVDEFGPVLLGGNPVNQLWNEEEKLALQLYAALSPQQAKNIQGKGGAGSGSPIGKSGIRIADLGEKPRALAKKLLQQRLAVFSADRRKPLEDLIKRDLGVDNMRIAFWGSAAKSHRLGGNYSWKIGSDSVLCDWQTVGNNHIHMTVRGKAKS